MAEPSAPPTNGTLPDGTSLLAEEGLIVFVVVRVALGLVVLAAVWCGSRRARQRQQSWAPDDDTDAQLSALLGPDGQSSDEHPTRTTFEVVREGREQGGYVIFHPPPLTRAGTSRGSAAPGGGGEPHYPAQGVGGSGAAYVPPPTLLLRLVPPKSASSASGVDEEACGQTECHVCATEQEGFLVELGQCGHVVCAGCASRMTSCPFCRAPIQSARVDREEGGGMEGGKGGAAVAGGRAAPPPQ